MIFPCYLIKLSKKRLFSILMRLNNMEIFKFKLVISDSYKIIKLG